MMDDTEFVIHRLVRYASLKDVTLEVCQRNGSSWEEAEHFVRRVEREYSHEIAARQQPWMILWSVLMILAGLVLMTASLVSLLNGQWIPMTLVLFIIEVDLPNGGQLLGIAASAGLLIGGTAGVCSAILKRKGRI